MSTHLALPQEFHLEQVLHVFGYPKIDRKIRLILDFSYRRISSKIFKEYGWFDFYMDAKEAIPPNIPESRGHKASVSVFVYADLVGYKSTRRIHTGVLIFINKAPIYWYSKW